MKKPCLQTHRSPLTSCHSAYELLESITISAHITFDLFPSGANSCTPTARSPSPGHSGLPEWLGQFVFPATGPIRYDCTPGVTFDYVEGIPLS